MDGNNILGLSKNQFYTLIFIILLIILGIVSFHFYTYISTHDNISAGAGVGFTLFPQQHKKHEEGYY